MKQKDLSEKVLEDNNDIFADIVNVLLFDGEDTVEECSLVNTTVHSQYKDGSGKLHEQEREYVNDVKANVFEIAWLTDEQISKFKSDFKIVANFFVNKRKNKDYIPDDKTAIKHVDEMLKFLSVMTGDNRYEKLLADKEGVSNMCDVAQRLEDRGIQIGIEKGINLGSNRMIYSLVEDKSISMEKGAEKLGISVEKLRANMINTGFKVPDKE